MEDHSSVAVEAPASVIVEARAVGRGARWLYLIPLVGFVGLGAMFYSLLGSDPHAIPSPLIGKPVPSFSLAPVKGHGPGLSSSDLYGAVSLVNVFASWCVACRAEHPLLMQLSKEKIVPLYGLDYKDPPDDATHWLDENGDPYARTGADITGLVAINWGVYGVPETFVVDAKGRIAYKQIGPLTPEILRRTILPIVARLRSAGVNRPVEPARNAP